MNPELQPEPPPQPPPKRRGTTLLRWTLIAGAVGVGTLFGLLLLAWTIENYRGKSAWTRFQAEAAARGEKLDLASVIPPSVPDQDNFAATPLLAALFEPRSSTSRTPRRRDPAAFERATALSKPFDGSPKSEVPASGNWETATPIDLGAWAEFFEQHPDFATPDAPGQNTAARPAPASVLDALQRFAPELTELAAAAERPAAVFPLHYEDNFNLQLPHLAVLRGISSLVRLRALARLQAGQTNQAFQDVQFGLRLVQSLKDEPLVISQLVRLAILHGALQPVWEGLRQQQWTEPQLTRLQEILSSINLLDGYHRCLRGERAFVNDLFDRLRSGRLNPGSIDNTGLGLPTGFQALPSGWLYQNQVAIGRIHQEYLLPVIDPAAHRAFPAKADAADQARELYHRNPYNFMAGLLLPALVKTPLKFAHRQATLDLAATACSLERHRLARGSYPDSLTALPPALTRGLHSDLISGQPLNYRPTDDGRFILYSIGWNETDDQGIPARRGRSESVIVEEGDWAWRYTPAADQ